MYTASAASALAAAFHIGRGFAINWVMPLKALFFDVGNTLLFPRREAMLLPLHQRRIFPSEDLLQKAERHAKRQFDFPHQNGSAVDQSFWHIYYSFLLDQLETPDEMICRDLVSRTRISANWCDIRPGTREALLRLAKKYRLGVISNADGKIAEVLKRCGIADCFESVTDSGIVGQEKPHPAIFEAALSSLEVAPQESLYIGDIYSVDYLGATSFGMQAVLFDAAGAYRDNGLPRVESLEQLEALLGSLT